MNFLLYPELLLFLQILSVTIKGLFFLKINKYKHNSPNPFMWQLLEISLISACIVEFSWIVYSANKCPELGLQPLIQYAGDFVLMVSWIASIIDYFSLALFVERLASRDMKKASNHIILFGILGVILSSVWFFRFVIKKGWGISIITILLLKRITIFYWSLCVLGVIFWVFRKIHAKDMSIPKLLRKQIVVFINFLIVPRLFIDVIVMNLIGIMPNYYKVFTPLAAIFASYIALYIVYYSAQKMLGMRFLNVSDHVTGQVRFNFIQDMKQVLQELGHVTSLSELEKIIKRFYENSFGIPNKNLRVIIFGQDFGDDQELHDILSTWLAEPFAKNMTVLVRDELEFSYFYQQAVSLEQGIACLNDSGADLLIPIYDKKNIIGAIVGLAPARPEKFFSAAEYDEMVVFSSYLGALINLLKHRSLDSLIQMEKDLKEELYLKHQEIKHYKEIIREFLARRDPDDPLIHQMNVLKDPTDWDYLLFLQTSQTGRLINKIIPGEGTQMLDFKINLLKAALSNRGVLIQLPEDDIMPTVELLHHISLKEHLEILNCDFPEHNHEYSLKMFGINPLYDKEHAIGLLERFDATTTLVIHNVENLSLTSQELLAQTLCTGFFYQLKSDRKRITQVRIMCTTSVSLAQLVHQGKFSRKLHHELMRTSATLPSLLTLAREDIESIAQGFAERITQDAYQAVSFELSSKEQQQLADNRPVSLREYKERVYNLLVKKARKKSIDPQEQFDEAYVEHGPELYQVAKLGKRALKDKQIMIFLWNKFKNQTKIAKILNVNRSSVNRRCRAYNLLP